MPYLSVILITSLKYMRDQVSKSARPRSEIYQYNVCIGIEAAVEWLGRFGTALESTATEAPSEAGSVSVL